MLTFSNFIDLEYVASTPISPPHNLDYNVEKNRSLEHLNNTKPKEHTMSSVDYPVGQVMRKWTPNSFMSPG